MPTGSTSTRPQRRLGLFLYSGVVIVLVTTILQGAPLRISSATIKQQAELVDFVALQRLGEHLCETDPRLRHELQSYLSQLKTYRANWPQVITGLQQNSPQALQQARIALSLKRDLLLANPLIDFDRLLLVKRRANQLGLSRNWQGNSDLPVRGYDNEIAVLSEIMGGGTLTTFYRPVDDVYVGDVDLDFDAQRLLFSMSHRQGPWRVYQMDMQGGSPTPLPLIADSDVDNYDACYLPNGDIIFNSTAPFVGVPCVQGASHVSNLFLFQDADQSIRRLTFEQDHNWYPTVLNNGRILYLRWEYTDIPHFASRILFHMNPDGSEQMAFYGSNSYWPNSLFFARPIPNSHTQFVAVVTGHHDVPRMGELVLFDVAQGRHEAQGVVQRLPGFGKKVEPIIRDDLVRDSWPKFLHPYPLSDKVFLTACCPSPQSLWGIYLVDVFDNLLLLKETPGYALLEPLPLRPVSRPPVLPSKVEPTRSDALVNLMDIYTGPGLRDVPRGTVKKLRLFTYHFAYHGMGGQVNRVGYDGPWDVKRIMGTVPVESDGSALFRVPANTPISIQPLDGEGKAIQLMRSWFTAMPGETLSCVGCHEAQNSTPTLQPTQASRKEPATIEPWYGPTRGFSFTHEVQPVLNRYCVECHNGDVQARDHKLPDFRPRPAITSKYGGRFTPAYRQLYRYVRSHTIESDLHLLNPYEFHADTTRLVQMLQRGHHGVDLSAEAWDRLITWIDLNTPAHGRWTDIVGLGKVEQQHQRRRDLQQRYAGIDEDPETPLTEAVLKDPVRKPTFMSCPLENESPFVKQKQPKVLKRRSLTLNPGITLDLLRLEDGLWMGETEVTNVQYAQFDPSHNSRLEHGDFLQFSEQERGYPVNEPQQPVVRISWDRAMAFCHWLSEKTGLCISLPTEVQWENACRAGTQSPFWYGDANTDFSPYANLADRSFQRVDAFSPYGLPAKALEEMRLAVSEVKDGYRVSAPVASFQPNPWGLYDMHGNVAEWTRSTCSLHPQRRIVRGGSWYDCPQQAHSAYQQSYLHWMGIYDVGFRIVCVENEKP